MLLAIDVSIRSITDLQTGLDYSKYHFEVSISAIK